MLNNTSDFLSTESSNSKMGLFNALCPFDVEVNEEAKTATITSAAKNIYYKEGKVIQNGAFEVTLAYLKGEKEYTFKEWFNDWEDKEETIQKAIGRNVISFVQSFLGRKLDLAGKDYFEFDSFQTFAQTLFGLIKPGEVKLYAALEFRSEESQYVTNFRLARLVEVEGQKKNYYPNLSTEDNLRIDLIINKTMTLLVEEEDNSETEEPVDISSDDELESLLSSSN